MTQRSAREMELEAEVQQLRAELKATEKENQQFKGKIAAMEEQELMMSQHFKRGED